jgi:hypothetical protein
MIVIGVDFHPEFQQIASVDTESGEFEERRLQHRDEAERFYRKPAIPPWGWTKNEERQLCSRKRFERFLCLRHYRVY